jgi:hypothetical protein
MARELTSAGLWVAIAISLVLLAQTLWRVGHAHFGPEQVLGRYGLPGAAVVACLGAVWRARRSVREFFDIRQEQARLTEELKKAEEELLGAEAEPESPEAG